MLSNEGKLALKGHIDYIQFTNHPVWKAAVKPSAWTLMEKSNALSCFNTDNGPGDKCYRNLIMGQEINGTETKKKRQLDQGRLRMAILPFGSSTLTC